MGKSLSGYSQSLSGLLLSHILAIKLILLLCHPTWNYILSWCRMRAIIQLSRLALIEQGVHTIFVSPL